MKKRRDARILAFQLILSRSKVGVNQLGEKIVFKRSNLSEEQKEFCLALLETTWRELVSIDKNIKEHLINWKQSRISSPLNSLLRLSACEIMFFPEIDEKVSINEAIDICRIYVDVKATNICNGVLNAIWKSDKI